MIASVDDTRRSHDLKTIVLPMIDTVTRGGFNMKMKSVNTSVDASRGARCTFSDTRDEALVKHYTTAPTRTRQS